MQYTKNLISLDNLFLPERAVNLLKKHKINNILKLIHFYQNKSLLYIKRLRKADIICIEQEIKSYLRNIRIEDIYFTTRTKNALKYLNIIKLQQLTKYNKNSLFHLDGLGLKSRREILLMLLRFGLMPKLTEPSRWHMLEDIYARRQEARYRLTFLAKAIKPKSLYFTYLPTPKEILGYLRKLRGEYEIVKL